MKVEWNNNLLIILFILLKIIGFITKF
jgi:hypothetical protein